MSLRVALCQFNGRVADTAFNLKLLQDTIQKHHSSADVFCFPELFREAYSASVSQFRESAESEDGPFSLQVRECAKKYSIYILYGYAERSSEGNIYNSAQLVSPEGAVLINYRKAHLYDPLLEHERIIFTEGEKLSPIVTIQGVRCALLICWDVEIVETCRELSLRGAQCFLVLTANMNPLTNTVVVRSRAMENNAFVVYVNRVADSRFCFSGHSVAYAPNGECIGVCSDTEEGVQVAIIDPNQQSYLQYLHENPLLKDRRPELYPSLTSAIKRQS